MRFVIWVTVAVGADSQLFELSDDPPYDRSWWNIQHFGGSDPGALFLVTHSEAAIVGIDGGLSAFNTLQVGDPPLEARVALGVHLPFGISGSGDPLTLGRAGSNLWNVSSGALMVESMVGPYEVSADVNGDGLLDLCGPTKLALSNETPWNAIALPDEPSLKTTTPDDQNPPFTACLPDLTGDGFGDLVVSAIAGGGFGFPSFGGPVALHAGGPAGYADTPEWVVENLFYDAPYSLAVVQRDDDPELELAALTRPVVSYGPLDSSSLVLLDDVATDPHRDGAYPTFADRGDAASPNLEAQLVNVGDVDGDGYDELAIPEGRGYGLVYDTGTPDLPHHIRIVSSASDGPVVDELGTLRFDVAETSRVDSLSLGVADLNEDGVTDLYGLACWRDCYVQVWYGPLSEHLSGPGETGDTGHTGAAADTSLTDTGPTPSPTADTASVDPGTPVSPQTPTDESRGCGCAIRTTPRSSWLARRRGIR